MPTILDVGASRGLGRGIALAFAEAGARVVAAARSGSALAELAVHPNVRAEIADATDQATAGRLIAAHQPQVVILVASASPAILPLQEHKWETF